MTSFRDVHHWCSWEHWQSQTTRGHEAVSFTIREIKMLWGIAHADSLRHEDIGESSNLCRTECWVLRSRQLRSLAHIQGINYRDASLSRRVSDSVSRMKTPTDLPAMLCTFSKDYTYSYRLGRVHRNYKYTTDELAFTKNLGQTTPQEEGLPIVVGVGEDMIDSTSVHSEQSVFLDVKTVSLPGDESGGQVHTSKSPLSFSVLPYSFTQSSCAMEFKLS
jgi:hypothetical protein